MTAVLTGIMRANLRVIFISREIRSSFQTTIHINLKEKQIAL
jgi:hypothetical protein